MYKCGKPHTFQTTLMKKYLLLSLSIGINILCFSQAGQLDPAYDRDGMQTTTFLKGNVLSESGKKLLQQADGKILAITSLAFSQGVVARYLPNGTLDASYGRGGFTQIINVGFNAAVLQPDGKLVAAGNSFTVDGDFGVVRFKTNGQVDSSFGTNGKQITDFGFYEQAFGIAIQRDGKIVVVGGGEGDFQLARYTSNGSLDNTFSGDGKLLTDFGFFGEAHAVAIQPDGKIVVAGVVEGSNDFETSNFGIARYTTSGILDNTFSSDGKQTTDFGFYDNALAVAIQTDGKIVVAGTAFVSRGFVSTGNFAVARYTTAGTPDNAFSGDGKQTTDFSGAHDAAFALALQADGKIVIAGIATNVTQNYGVVRYTTNGTLDNTFSGDGKQQKDFGLYDAAYSVLIQTDGKIVLAGESFNDSNYDLSLARYTSGGVPDPTFSSDGFVFSFLPADAPVMYNGAASQSDGKLVVAGFVQHKVTGSPGGSDFAIARYNTNGILDNSFDFNGKLTTNLGSTDAATAVAIQSDGKIVVAGRSDTNIAVARYNSNGTLDNTFNGTGKVVFNLGAAGYASSVAIQPNGKIVIAGAVVGAIIDGQSIFDFVVVRFNSNGTPDNTFSGDGKMITDFGEDDVANDVVIQKNGKILVAGTSLVNPFESYFALARYNTNGTLDNSFSGDGKQVKNFRAGIINEANSVALQEDGKIVVAGSVSDGVQRSFLVARYNTIGNLDNSFNFSGFLAISFSGIDEAKSVVIQPDGKSVVGGGTSNGQEFALARIRLNGTLDPVFGSGGKQITSIPLNFGSINAVVISGSRLYAAGGYEFAPGIRGLTAAYRLGSVSVLASNDRVDELPANKAFGVSAQPNPASTYFTLRAQSSTSGSVQLRVLDVTGKLMEQQIMPANGSIDIGHHYQPGVYFIQVTQGNENTVLRLVKAGK
jgi:uncharacterized delta-60 repeat protein